MNMPFRHPAPSVRQRPAQKVLVDRATILEVITVMEETKTNLDKAIALLESGRTDSAAQLFRQIRRRLG